MIRKALVYFTILFWVLGCRENGSTVGESIREFVLDEEKIQIAIKQGLIPEHFEMEGFKPIHFTGVDRPEFALLGACDSGCDEEHFRTCYVLGWNREEGKWEKVLEHGEFQSVSLEMTCKKLSDSSRDNLIVTTLQGSGGYMSCYVYGFMKGEVKTLMEDIGNPYGQFWVEDNVIYTSFSDMFTTWQWNGEAFIPTELENEPEGNNPENTRVVFYSVDDDGIVMVSEDPVYLQKGDPFLLLRRGRGDIARVLFSLGEEESLFDDSVYPWLAFKPGLARFTIYGNPKRDVDIIISEAE